ncbi:MAG: methyltransferase domain-containing protein [Dehalococcoidia bacterium]|nr:methyltransferase domain-containing protein [Dehalococcoidia bacterium]
MLYDLGYYPVLRCPRCGLRWAGPAGDGLPDSARPADRPLVVGDLPAHEAKATRDLAMIAPRLAAGASILDVGSGGGAFLAVASAAGFSVTGLEPDSQRAALARSTYGVTVHETRLEDCTLPEASFQAVVAFCVIAHVESPLRFLQAAACLLQPGGLLFLHTPAADGLYKLVAAATYRGSLGRVGGPLRHQYMPWGHRYILGPRAMGAALEGAGFVTAEFSPYSNPAEITNRRFDARPAWQRLPLTGAVTAINAASRVSGRTNHLAVFAHRSGAVS